MSLISSDKGGGDFQQLPVGNHTGVCYAVTDIGTQLISFPGSEDTKKEQLIIFWEFPELKLDDGRLMSGFKFYNNSLHELAKLRGDLEKWRGLPFTPDELKGFNVGKLIGATAMLQVKAGTTDPAKTKVDGVFPRPEGTPAIQNTVNDHVLFDSDIYLMEFGVKGESCEDSKNMADMLEIMPPIARKKYFESIEFKTHVPEETQQLLMGGGPEAPITPPVSSSVGGLSAMASEQNQTPPPASDVPF
jgi:hypothetical protein